MQRFSTPGNKEAALLAGNPHRPHCAPPSTRHTTILQCLLKAPSPTTTTLLDLDKPGSENLYTQIEAAREMDTRSLMA